MCPLNIPSSNVDISIVIPAFNEAKRLPPFLENVIKHCESSKLLYEIVVVDDGSEDETFDIARTYKSRFLRLTVVRNRVNRGKGYAVKKGLFRSAGRVCIFLDADGSVHPREIEKNLHYISNEGYDIFIGSRAIYNESQILKVKWYRKLISTVFNFFVHIFLFKNIQDAQCGFKMFKKEIIRPIFAKSHLRGFGFDVEILYLAYRMGYKVREGPVSWHYVSGSKINLFTDSIKMFINILQVRNWHAGK